MAALGTPKYATIHCSANKAGTGSVAQLNATDKARFGQNSYHFIIDYDGKITENLPLNVRGAHVGNHNTGNIGICYIGGLDKAGKATDTRTPAQIAALETLVRKLKSKYPALIFKGHRDWSPDINKDGKITPNEWLKSCPCFDVAAFIKSIKI